MTAQSQLNKGNIPLFWPAANQVDQVFDKYVRVCDHLSTFSVENLVANLLHQSRHVETDAAGSLVRVRAC